MKFFSTLALCAGVAIVAGCGAGPDETVARPPDQAEPMGGSMGEPLASSDTEGWQLAQDFPDTSALDAEIERLRAAVAEDQSSAAAHRELALKLREAKRRHEALEHFAVVASLEPDNERDRLNLALAYSATAQLEPAEEIYRELIDSPNLRPMALHNLGSSTTGRRWRPSRTT
jgi:tetratricopeptide (TPR) repeat protein